MNNYSQFSDILLKSPQFDDIIKEEIIEWIILSCHTNVQTWINTWSFLSMELSIISKQLGMIESSIANSDNRKESVSYLYLNKYENGTMKFKQLESLYDIITFSLIQLIMVGCASGTLSFNLGPIIVVISHVLSIPYDPKIKNSLDTKDIIRNEFNVNPKEFHSILLSLQMNSLHLITSIVNTHQPSLLQMAHSISNPVFSLLSITHHSSIPYIFYKSHYQCIHSVIANFPNLLNDSKNKSVVGKIFDTFQSEIEYLTKSPTSVTNNDASHESQSDDNEEDSKMFHGDYNDYVHELFVLLEALLLYTGHALLRTHREKLQLYLIRGLQCLARGILPPQRNHRNLRRGAHERIRRMPALQNCFLRLCVTDSLMPGVAGHTRGLLTLLTKVCQSSLLQNETSLEAARALAIIDILRRAAGGAPSNSQILAFRNIGNTYADGTSAYGDYGINNNNEMRNEVRSDDIINKNDMSYYQNEIQSNWNWNNIGILSNKESEIFEINKKIKIDESDPNALNNLVLTEQKESTDKLKIKETSNEIRSFEFSVKSTKKEKKNSGNNSTLKNNSIRNNQDNNDEEEDEYQLPDIDIHD